jgi:hypothetical protein
MILYCGYLPIQVQIYTIVVNTPVINTVSSTPDIYRLASPAEQFISFDITGPTTGSIQFAASA